SRAMNLMLRACKPSKPTKAKAMTASATRTSSRVKPRAPVRKSPARSASCPLLQRGRRCLTHFERPRLFTPFVKWGRRAAAGGYAPAEHMQFVMRQPPSSRVLHFVVPGIHAQLAVHRVEPQRVGFLAVGEMDDRGIDGAVGIEFGIDLPRRHLAG